jgi:hypothetical protein
LDSYCEHHECKAAFKAFLSLKEILLILSKREGLCKNSFEPGILEGRECRPV